MLGVYVEKELAQELKRLACRRDITMTSIVKDVLHREINSALASGELAPRETAI